MSTCLICGAEPGMGGLQSLRSEQLAAATRRGYVPTSCLILQMAPALGVTAQEAWRAYVDRFPGSAWRVCPRCHREISNFLRDGDVFQVEDGGQWNRFLEGGQRLQQERTENRMIVTIVVTVLLLVLGLGGATAYWVWFR